MAMKRYEQNFKDEALKLSDDIGVKKACEQLNLNYGTLSGWRKQRVKRDRTKKKPADEVLEENARLKKENDELKKSNEILKDALCFFARDRKR